MFRRVWIKLQARSQAPMGRAYPPMPGLVQQVLELQRTGLRATTSATSGEAGESGQN